MDINQSGKKNSNYRHGGHVYHRPELNSWRAMKERCNNPNYWAYARYGGRGIKLCERWNNFANFLEDMGKKPSPKHSLDRIDGNKDYSPDNCRWATQKQQMAHTNKSKFVEIDGITRTITEWCGIYGKTRSQVYNRLTSGWDVERALKTPINPNGVNFNRPQKH